MTKIAKIAALGVLACGIFASNAFGAEKEGAFAGVELGANKANFKQSLDITNPLGGGQINGDIKANNFLPSIAVKGGYKWFFSQNFGVRAYGQIGVGYGTMKSVKYSDSLAAAIRMMPNATNNATNSIFTGTGKTYYTTFIDYFVGADLLYNFVSSRDYIFGVYGGLGIGAVTWIANGKEYEVSNGDRTYIDFSANANIGLRSIIKEKHGVELGARFYFPKSKLFEASNGTSPLIPEPMRNQMKIADTETTHTRPFSIILSYTYNF